MKMLVYGSREFGKVVRRLAGHCGHEWIGFIDDVHGGEGVLGPYEKVAALHPPGAAGIALAIGYNDLPARWRVFEQLARDGYDLPALVHPRADVDASVNVGRGAFVMAGALVDVDASLGDAAVLWPGAIVSHDSRVGRNCFLSPGATVCGKCTIGADSFMGGGSIVVDHREVPAGSFLKAGAVWS